MSEVVEKFKSQLESLKGAVVCLHSYASTVNGDLIRLYHRYWLESSDNGRLIEIDPAKVEFIDSRHIYLKGYDGEKVETPKRPPKKTLKGSIPKGFWVYRYKGVWMVENSEAGPSACENGWTSVDPESECERLPEMIFKGLYEWGCSDEEACFQV